MFDTHSLTLTLGEISSFERFPRIDSIRISSNYYLFNKSDELEKYNRVPKASECSSLKFI